MNIITAELNTLKGEILASIKLRDLGRFKYLTEYQTNVLNEVGEDLRMPRGESESNYNYSMRLYENGLNENIICFYDKDLFN